MSAAGETPDFGDRVDLADERLVQHWSALLEVSEYEIRQAVTMVGARWEAMCWYLSAIESPSGLLH